MRLWKKVVVAVLMVVLVLPALFAATMYAGAWYYRWRAGQLLIAMRSVTPGSTTEVDFLRIVAPFDNHLVWTDDGKGHRVSPPGWIEVRNSPLMPERVTEFFHSQLEFLSDHRVIPATVDFVVLPSFRDGVVSSLAIQEMQGAFRPLGGFVTVASLRYLDKDDPFFGKTFGGYWVTQRHLQDGSLWESHVYLDERATVEERQRALRFDFQCFTQLGLCRDGSKMLQPAPNRPGLNVAF